MSRLFLAVAAVLCLSELAPARAQFYGGPFYPPGYRYSAAYGSGFAFSVGGPHFRISGFSGGFVTRSVYVARPVYVAPAFVAPFGPVVPFGAGWGPGFGAPVVAVPVPVAIPVPVAVGGIGGDPNEPLPLPGPRGGPPGEFLVIAPQRDAVPELPRPIDVRPPGPKIKFDPFKEPVKVEVLDPKKEAARLLKVGRASFAAGDYGRAAEHFEQLSAADPADALPYFLQAQAKFAAGQYAEAAARLRDGLARDPKWPASAFKPTELYGDKPERFVLHLIDLKRANTDNPGQAVLEFLLGYQLWFSGERAEADKLFRAAEKRLADPGPLALFKLP